jgi:acyl dehydratase
MRKEARSMLDRNAVGRASPPTLNEVEKGAIRRFAESIGDFNPVYYDEEFARGAGYPTLLAPPTFPASFHSVADLRELLGVSIKSLLHAEQSFDYERPIFAGDRIYVSTRVAEVMERTGPAGKMDVAVIEDEGRDEDGTLVFRARRTLVVRTSKEAM